MTQNIDKKEKANKAELGKKPYWYLFLLANVIVIVGCAITFAFIYKEKDIAKNLLSLPTLICNVAAVIPAGFFVWLELRDISPKIMHFHKKWLTFYIVSASFFVLTILFNTLFFCIASRYQEVMIKGSTKKWIWIIYLVITVVLSLVSIGFQRYARYRIDLDVYRRKHGEEIKDNESKKPEEVKAEKPVEPSEVTTPTGGLIDQMDK